MATIELNREQFVSYFGHNKPGGSIEFCKPELVFNVGFSLYVFDVTCFRFSHGLVPGLVSLVRKLIFPTLS